MIILKFPVNEKDEYKRAIRQAFAKKTWFGYKERGDGASNLLWPIDIENKTTLSSPMAWLDSEDVAKLLRKHFKIARNGDTLTLAQKVVDGVSRPVKIFDSTNRPEVADRKTRLRDQVLVAV